MVILVVIAVVCLILGLLFMTNVQMLDKLSNAMNKVVISTKSMPKEQAKGVGIFLIAFALVLFFIALKLGR